MFGVKKLEGKSMLGEIILVEVLRFDVLESIWDTPESAFNHVLKMASLEGVTVRVIRSYSLSVDEFKGQVDRNVVL
jgi:hypothetical protein